MNKLLLSVLFFLCCSIAYGQEYDDAWGKKSPEVSVYPNPFENSFTIKIIGEEEPGIKVELYNISGIRVWNTGNNIMPEEPEYINNPLAEGMYILRIYGKNFNKTFRIIKIDK